MFHVFNIIKIGSNNMKNLKTMFKKEQKSYKQLKVISVKGSASKMTLGGKGPVYETFVVEGNYYG